MPDGTFLLIGHADDSCCVGVVEALEHLGHDVILTTDPLTHPFALHWRLGSEASGDTNAWGEADRSPRKLSGVLVRCLGGPVNSEERDAKDFAYARVESQAALIAWLWSLDCPVVNRPSERRGGELLER